MKKISIFYGLIKIIALLLCLVCIFNDFLLAVRARPSLDPKKRTFVSDIGTPLRGMYASTCEYADMPSREEIALLKELGCNTLHVYGEFVYDLKPVGYAADKIDTLVQWTKELDLYLILTCGIYYGTPCAGKANYFGKVRDFWTFYASRYANEQHVLYEIFNEPSCCPVGYPTEIINMEGDCYRIIKQNAPNSPILILTYPLFTEERTPDCPTDLSDPSVPTDINNLTSYLQENYGLGIDWNNTAIAFHNYAGDQKTEEYLRYVLNIGYPCFETEFAIDGDIHYEIWPPQVSLCENLELSWLCFVNSYFIEHNQYHYYKDPLIQAGIVWVPDFDIS